MSLDISYTTPRSRTTPFLLAVKCGRVDIVRVLIESGARVSAKDALGHSGLFYASRYGNTDLVELLLIFCYQLRGVTRGVNVEVNVRMEGE